MELSRRGVLAQRGAALKAAGRRREGGMMGTMRGTRCAITPGPTARFGIGSWPSHFGAADVGILIVSPVFVSAIAVAVTPAKSRPLAPSEQSSVGAAEHPPARPGNAI